MSWTRLVRERLLAVVVGTAIITAGLGRLVLSCLLLGGALGGVAAVAVALARTGPAVPALAVFIAASYLLSLFAPLFGWPDWVARLSVFTALGDPYLEWPGAVGVTLMVGLSVAGVLLGGLIAERTPKVT